MNYILFVDKIEYIISDPEVISLIIFNSINVIYKIYSKNTLQFDIINILPEIKVSCYESFFKIDDLFFDYKKLEFYGEKSKLINLELNRNLKKFIKFKLNSLLNQDNDNQEIDKRNEMKEKIKMLKNKQKNLQDIKKEKNDEINRRFEVDYDIYISKYDFFKNEVPELFKYKFEVFEEMKNRFDINNKSLCKEYYIKNYDRINKSIGSDNYSKIFDQKEKEEEI